MNIQDPITQYFPRLTKEQKTALAKLGIVTVRDLLYHFPSRYDGGGGVASVAGLTDGIHARVYGTLSGITTKKSFRGGVPMAEGKVTDATGTLKVMWFHQPYVAKLYTDGMLVAVTGSVKRAARGTVMMNPEIEKVDMLPRGIAGNLFVDGNAEGVSHDTEGMTLYPVYPESRGITSRWFYHATTRLFSLGALTAIGSDPLPDDIRARYHLPELSVALQWVHTPRKEEHAKAARKRFAFEEIFLIQIERQKARHVYMSHSAPTIIPNKSRLTEFIRGLGFPLTGAQKRAIDTILLQFAHGTPMMRLLEGDVGSGKTAVAAVTAEAVVTTRPKGQSFGNLQVAYMCPTEILATQQFASFTQNFVGTDIAVGLITGSGCKKFPSKIDPSGTTDIARTQFLKWVANGEIPVVVGTHALIQKSVVFKHLAYVIIDEQHRFGTNQRAKLVQKDGGVPHLLSMTATPIPRTLALTLYGDLDLTLLDEMPAGRKGVITEIVTAAKRKAAEETIRRALKEGRQAYVICPRINEPDPDKEMALQAKDVTSEAKRLKENIFNEFTIGILHGKMTPREKDRVMEEFAAGSIHILVATSVVEVGVNVPNATVIAIEGAERFGLAQLHQLRGRVMRSSHQAYCYLFTEAKAATSWARLKALASAANGFQLAEKDLALRGAGELGSTPSTGSGPRQWGVSDIGMEAIKNIKMVEAARTEATRILDEDRTLTGHPALRRTLAARATLTHLE